MTNKVLSGTKYVIGILIELFILIVLFNIAAGLLSSASDAAVITGFSMLLGMLFVIVWTGTIWFGKFTALFTKQQQQGDVDLKNMAKLLVIGVALGLTLFATSGCTNIPGGYVGIKVNSYGSQKGVDDYPALTGMVFYNPFTTSIFKFPTFMQNAIWCKSANEGRAVDESISFNSSEGAAINADIGFAYSFVRNSVPLLFVDFHQSAQELTDGYLRNQVRDAFSRMGSPMKVTDIFGAKKQEFLTSVKEDLNTRLGKYFVIDMVTFTSALRLDPTVEASINAVIQAGQKALEAENKVRESKAQADQKIEDARGASESKLKIATAEAEGNEKLKKSLTPEVLLWQFMSRWNGVAPMVVGGGTPLLDMKELASKFEKMAVESAKNNPSQNGLSAMTVEQK